MFECLIIGDSIATGVASVKPECAKIATIGLSSADWLKQNNKRPIFDMSEYRYVVISLGTNDYTGDKTEDHLLKIRSRLHADKVIWLLPSEIKKKEQFQIVMDVCRGMGDICMDIDNFTGRDRIHPPTVRAYEELAVEIKRRLR
jgi:hypothetical protein